jgi:hypothetical protein
VGSESCIRDRIVQRLEPAEEVGDTALGILRLNLEHGGRGVELLPVVRDLMAERAFRKVAGAAGRQRLEVLVRDLLRGCASWHHGRGFPLGAEVGDLQMALEALEREVGHAKR